MSKTIGYESARYQPNEVNKTTNLIRKSQLNMLWSENDTIIDNYQLESKIIDKNDEKANADIDYLVSLYSKISKDLLYSRYNRLKIKANTKR